MNAMFAFVAEKFGFADGAAILDFYDFVVFNCYFDIIA